MICFGKKFIAIGTGAAFALALFALMLSPAGAVEGYDSEHLTRITIIAGDKIAIGEEMEIYVWNERRFATVWIEDIVKRGNDLELHVTDAITNTYRFFEILADDPGLDGLPHFDPGRAALAPRPDEPPATIGELDMI